MDSIVFISHFTIKPGMLARLKLLAVEVATRLEAEKPRTLAYLAYLGESSTQATFIHVFADPESMDLHFQGADERSRLALELMDPNGWEIYGRPNDDTLRLMRETAISAKVSLNVHLDFLAGFQRVAG